MSKFGVIQNEEALQEVLRTEETVIIPCRNKADAHSKLVSLSNAKRRLPLFQQKLLRVQKEEVGGEWEVKVFPAAKAVFWKIVNGERVRWNPDEGKLSDEGQRMLTLMVKDGLSLEDIITNLSDEKEGEVRKAYEQVAL